MSSRSGQCGRPWASDWVDPLTPGIKGIGIWGIRSSGAGRSGPGRSVRECKLLGRDPVPGGDQVIDLAGAVARTTHVEADLRGLDAADIFDAAVLLHVWDGRFDGALPCAGRADGHRSGHLSNELARGQRVIGGSWLRRPD